MTEIELHKLLMEKKLPKDMYFWEHEGRLLFEYYRPNGTLDPTKIARLRSGKYQFLFSISKKLNSYWVNIVVDKVVERFTKLLKAQK